MIEDKIIEFLRHELKEHLILFRERKMIKHFIGNEVSVEFEKVSLHYFDGSIVYHNHVLGSSFSESDIVEAIQNNVLEFHLITKYHIYSIKRPKKGWDINFNDQEVLSTFEKCKDFAKLAINSLLIKNEIRVDEIDLLFNHYIWLLFFEKYEISYQKKAI